MFAASRSMARPLDGLARRRGSGPSATGDDDSFTMSMLPADARAMIEPAAGRVVADALGTGSGGPDFGRAGRTRSIR
jgi:hypothetical protein